MRYRKKSPVVEAVQWLQDGDHDQVQQYHPPEHVIPENPYCSDCGNRMERHGLMEGSDGFEIVCPTDYILTDRGGVPSRYTRAQFESQYEPYARPPRFADVPLSDLEERNQQRPERRAP